jgi:hypothetical protein
MCMDAFRCSDFSPCSYHPDAWQASPL